MAIKYSLRSIVENSDDDGVYHAKLIFHLLVKCRNGMVVRNPILHVDAEFESRNLYGEENGEDKKRNDNGARMVGRETKKLFHVTKIPLKIVSSTKDHFCASEPFSRRMPHM